MIETNTCLKPRVTDHHYWLHRLYKFYQRGILLNNEGLLNQSNYYLTMMELIEMFDVREEKPHGRT